MNRTQRAKIKLLRNAQNTARNDKNRELKDFGRDSADNKIKCRHRIEKMMKKEVVAKKNLFKEAKIA